MKKFEKKKIRKELYLLAEEQILGNKTQFEVFCKTVEAISDVLVGYKQALNITNAQLSNKAKNGLQYLQEIDATIQQIKALKQSMEDDLVVIDSQPEDPEPQGDNNG